MTAPATLPQRMREAADTLAEANELYTFNPEHGVWSPKALRHEADVIEDKR
jgi:hypothetical protein